jgi:hypothetical protein
MNHGEWYQAYTAALLELDRSKVRGRISEAEVAIFSRIQKLSQDPDSDPEREKIADALSSLHALQGTLLRNP